MGDIVINRKNMIDTNLFDSINRDTHKLGLFYSSFDSYPLYSGARIIENEICYPVTVLILIAGNMKEQIIIISSVKDKRTD